MSSVNKAILIGNAGKAPELRIINENNKVATFTLATNERYTDRNGQRQEKTMWHNIVVYGNSAEFASKYIVKGSEVYVEGKINYRQYEREGATVYVTEIITSDIQLTSRNQQSQNQQQTPQAQVFPSATPKQQNIDDLPW